MEPGEAERAHSKEDLKGYETAVWNTETSL